MSDMVLNERRDDLDHDYHEHDTRGRGLNLSLPPSQSHKSTGKGRFAHRKHQKSKSLCTLETNLDELGEDGDDPALLRRVPSVHELRVTKSLQKLNVPDWFKQSSLSKSSSCLLKYGSSSTMNSFSFSPSLISSPCASTAPPAPNVVIKTRVVPPSNPRALRSPNVFATSSPSMPLERKPPVTPVKLPSERLREKEKNKNLMPIPIVPFSQIRAMFEKKAKAGEEKKQPAGGEDKRPEHSRETKVKPEKTPVVSKPVAVPSISVSSEHEEVRQEEPPPVKRTLFEKPPVSSATRTSSPPPVAQETFRITASAPVSAPVQAVSRPQSHRATNGVSDDVDGNFMSSPTIVVTPRPDTFPPPAVTGRPHPVTEKPPISPTSAEPKPWREAKDSSRKHSPKDSSQKEPKSPPKDSKQQFSPSRSLRQFFGRSKDKSSEKKSGSEGGGGSLDSSFSSGDGVYEKEPRRLGGSEISRRSQPTTTSASFERRSDLDSSFSSGEGLGMPPGAADTSSRSLEGAPPRTSSRSPQSNFPAPGVPRPAYPNSEQQQRHQPPFSRFAPQEDSSSTTTTTTPKVSDGGEVVGGGGGVGGGIDPRYYHMRLPAAGTSYGHVSFSSENGEHVPESSASTSSSPRADSSATAVGEKKSVKETTV